MNNLIIRKIKYEELPDLLELYAELQPNDPILDINNIQNLWDKIYSNENYLYLVAEVDNRLVAACVLTIIENLTRAAKPYGLIENVVTSSEFRKRGIGQLLIKEALSIAWENKCYKVMLLTGSKKEETLRFYENCGFKKGEKTGFIAKP